MLTPTCEILRRQQRILIIVISGLIAGDELGMAALPSRDRCHGLSLVAGGLSRFGTIWGWSVPHIELLSMRWDAWLHLVECVDELVAGRVPAVQERILAAGERLAVNGPFLRV